MISLNHPAPSQTAQKFPPFLSASNTVPVGTMARLYLYAAILSSSYINLQLFQGCYARSLCSLAHQRCKLIHLLHFISSTRLMSLVLLTCPYSVRSSYRVKALSGARVLLVELLVPSSTIRHPYMRMPELLGRKLTG